MKSAALLGLVVILKYALIIAAIIALVKYIKTH